MQFLKLAGEAFKALETNIVRSGDGSWVAVEQDKGAYYAGDVMQGYVVAQLNSPRQIDRVLVRVSCVEETYWDEEISRTISEGEGEHKKVRTVYEHREHRGRDSVLDAMVVVSSQPMLMGAGNYKFPFQFPFDRTLPGAVRFSRERRAQDPAWGGRMLHERGDIVYRIEALVDVAGVFARDLTSSQMLAVNSYFDWSKMQPAHGENHGRVVVCCCVDRGAATLICDFDKSAYAAGETVQVRAVIKNESKDKIGAMKVRLVRDISLTSNGGHTKNFRDEVCRAKYAGVESGQSAERDLPLPLRNDSGALLPGTRGRKVSVSYTFTVECDLCCAPDIVVSMNPVIYTPIPATFGLAALGVTAAPGLALSFGGGFAAPAQQQVMVAPPGVQQMPQQQMMPQQSFSGPPQSYQQQAQQQYQQPQQYQQQQQMPPPGYGQGAGQMPPPGYAQQPMPMQQQQSFSGGVPQQQYAPQQGMPQGGPQQAWQPQAQ